MNGKTYQTLKVITKRHLTGRMDERVCAENMAINSKRKGIVGELEVASILREYGYNARRGQQYSGIHGDADVVGVPGLHIEVKRREQLNIHEAMDQAKRDARQGEIPSVIHRKSHTEWLVTVRLEDFLTIYREYEAGLAEVWLNDTK